MAGFNEWFMGMLESGWQGIENLGTDILDWFGLGTNRRAQEHDEAMLDKQNAFNAERDDIAWERQLDADNTKVQRNLEDLKAAGLNPYMLYGSGSLPSSTPSSSSASAGSGGRAALQGNVNIIGQLSGLLNSVTNARALDYQINRKSENETTNNIYGAIAKIIKLFLTKNMK